MDDVLAECRECGAWCPLDGPDNLFLHCLTEHPFGSGMEVLTAMEDGRAG